MRQKAFAQMQPSGESAYFMHLNPLDRANARRHPHAYRSRERERIIDVRPLRHGLNATGVAIKVVAVMEAL